MRPSDLTQRPIADLVPYARNSRTHSEAQVAQIAASITEFGFTSPVLVDAEGGIIAGHGRVLAAQSLGLETVPVLVLDHLSEAQRRAYVIADNKLAENAGWDDDALRAEIEELARGGYGLDVIGFDADELEALLNPPSTSQADPDEVPEPPAIPVTRPGDVWLMDKHRIICGDSTDAETVAALLQGAKPHLMVTDPPYGVNVVGREGKIGGSVLAKNQRYEKVIGDDRPFDPSFLFAICPDGVVFGANYFPEALPSRGQWIVWDKGRPEGTTFSDAELAWTSGKGIAVRMYRCVWNGMTREGESGARVHPTQKPVKLFAEIVGDFASPGALIFEPFSGSGTTIIAAEMTGRRCYAIELSPAYVDVAVKRWEDFAGRVATLQATGQSFREVADERRALAA
jgi:hypothetical protein